MHGYEWRTKRLIFTAFFLYLLSGLSVNADESKSKNLSIGQINCLSVLPAAGDNDFYVSNRAPLAPNPLIKLPPGAIRPEGWLKVWLELERDGMVGHLEEVSHWVHPSGNAWLDPEGKVGELVGSSIEIPTYVQMADDYWAPPELKGKRWSRERVPYWLRGFGDMGYILDDEELIRKADIWRNAVLENQHNDGYFGPLSEKAQPDLWPNMLMLNCLESYYEALGDKRIIPFMLKYFRYVDTVPVLYSGRHHVAARGGDMFYNIIWTYNRTGEEWLLELAEKVHQHTYNWTLGIYATLKADFEACPGAHCVNIAQGLREPAQYYQLNHDRQFLNITETYWQDLRKTFGQFAGGMYASDERCRPGFIDPRQGIETCAIVEFMRTAEILTGISGDTRWADRCEDVAFNSFPAALMPDFRGLHYLTSANCVQLDHEDKRPVFRNGGPMFSYSPHTKYHCCQHNVSMGWPYYAEHLWYAARGNGLAAVMYCRSKVTARVGDGTLITIEENTDYPFDDIIHFKMNTPKAVSFPWILRIPGWCQEASITINGRISSVPLKPGSFAVINRTWNDGDRVDLKLPMNLTLTRWEGNKNSLSVNRGPLSFSLMISERWKKYIGKEQNQGTDTWPEWEVFPDSPWNYALELDPENLTENFEVKVGIMPEGQVFTPESAPITITTKGRKVPGWKMENGVVGLLPESPLKTSESIETITLVPMGCVRLRITSFPWYEAAKPEL